MKAHAILLLAALPLVATLDAQNKQGAPAPASAPLTLQVLEDGQGPPLVILAGGTAGASAYDPHARLLAQDFRVLRPQSLRFGRSESNPLPPQYSIKMESDALARSLDQRGIREPVALVGHSFGALVALDFALDRPERVRALVLAEPPAFWVVPSEERRTNVTMRKMIELTLTLVPSAEPTDEQLVKFQTLNGRTGSAPLRQGQPGWEDWASRRAALRGMAAVPNHTDDPSRLETLQTPVLIVTGKDTVSFLRRCNDLLAARLPAVERVELPGNHRAPETAPTEFVAALRDFITRHPCPQDVVVRYIKQVIDGRNLSILEELFQPDIIMHRPGKDLNGISGARTFFEDSPQRYSEIHTVIHDIIASGDRVVVRLSHQAVGAGVFTSRLGDYDIKGKTLRWDATAIFRMKDGKIAEEWVNRDELGMLLSSGAVRKKD